MGIDDTLDAMTKSSEKALSPIDAVRTLKSYIDIQHFVEFIASATPNEIELISRCIQAIKQGFLSDCDLDETVESTETIESMREWPELLEFINRWMMSL